MESKTDLEQMESKTVLEQMESKTCFEQMESKTDLEQMEQITNIIRQIDIQPIFKQKTNIIDIILDNMLDTSVESHRLGLSDLSKNFQQMKTVVVMDSIMDLAINSDNLETIFIQRKPINGIIWFIWTSTNPSSSLDNKFSNDKPLSQISINRYKSKLERLLGDKFIVGQLLFCQDYTRQFSVRLV